MARHSAYSTPATESDAAGAESAPAIAAGPTTNEFDHSVQVIIQVGGTATTITKNATAIAAAVTATVVTVNLAPGESLTFDQIVAVSWTWFGV